MNRNSYGDERPINMRDTSQPIHVDTLEDDNYRVDQFGKAIVGPAGFGDFGYPPGQSPAQSVNKEVTLTPDDMRILRECNRESFMQRCLPLMTAANLLTYLYYQTRATSVPGRKFGAYIGVTILGWVAGKMSYRSKCEDKLINAGHNSKLVEVIRKRRGITASEFEPDQHWQSSPSSSSSSDWRIEDQQANKQSQSSYDSSYSADNYYGNDEGSQQSSSVSYDSLRQQNRSRSPASSSQDLRSRPTF